MAKKFYSLTHEAGYRGLNPTLEILNEILYGI